MIAHDRVVDAVLDAGGFAHGFTYAGNPLACSAGLAVIKEIEENSLMENAAASGTLLKRQIEDLMTRYEMIGDVRGQGLLLAFELVSDRKAMTPLPAGLNAFNRLVDIAYDNGLIIYSRRTRDGIEGDHFLVCPPMIATEEHVDEIIEKLDKSLQQFEAEISKP
jgi:adenosylmethionine-8-amino-7-oxononanoate aminotransferase